MQLAGAHVWEILNWRGTSVLILAVGVSGIDIKRKCVFLRIRISSLVNSRSGHPATESTYLVVRGVHSSATAVPKARFKTYSPP